MKTIKISKRLFAVSEYVEDNSNLLDVGCDHALLDIYLYQHKNNLQVTVSDLHKLPLDNAKNNLEKYRLIDKIKTCLGDGLEVLDLSIDTIIITGMGGRTIINILNNKDKLVNIQNIILSPNNDYLAVRKAIHKLGYYIDQETMIKDKGIFYLIISFKKGQKKYSAKELYFGPLLLRKKTPVTKEYFGWLLTKKEKILADLPRKYFFRRLKIKREISQIKSNILR